MRAQGAPGRGGGADQEAGALTDARPRATREWTFIGLGGNLGGRAVVAARFADAQAAIEALTDVAGQRSSLYASAPVGPIADQPEFLNAVLALPFQPPDPVEFLDALETIEILNGRVRGVAQGPRTLDLDLLLIGRRVIATDRLVVPHRRLDQRRFVLEPLVELVGADFALPDGRTLGALLATPALAEQPVARLPDELG